MKTAQNTFRRPGYRAIVYPLALGLLCAGNLYVRAQWAVIGTPPSPWQGGIQSTGGITYFVHTTGTLTSCYKVDCSPVTLNGTNLTMAVAEMHWLDICLDELCHSDINATVLGSLPAGNYRLWLYQPELGLPSPVPTQYLWRTIDFSVPEASGPTLTAAREGGGVRVSLNGTPAATYVLEASGTLGNWTPVYTNSGATFAFSTNTTSAPSQFYRVRAQSGTLSTSVPCF